MIGRAAECSLLAPATTHTGRGPFEHRRLLAAGFAGVLLLVGCGGPRPKTDGPPGGSVDFSRIPDALPRVEPLSRYGNRPTYEVLGHTYRTLPSSEGYVERGIASWYGTKFHGRPTSSMEPYDLYAMTAAHRSLPLPSYVEVRNLENGRRVVVKVNDRGPFHPNRIIDLSYAAAGKLGILDKGTGLVELRAIDPQHPGSAPSTTEATTRTAPGERAGSRPPSPSIGTPASDPEYSRRAEPGRHEPVASPPALFIQVGAFADRGNAYRLRERLKSTLGQTVRIDESDQSGYPVYRVQIGPLADVDTADRLHLHLADMGIASTQMIIESGVQ